MTLHTAHAVLYSLSSLIAVPPAPLTSRHTGHGSTLLPIGQKVLSTPVLSPLSVLCVLSVQLTATALHCRGAHTGGMRLSSAGGCGHEDGHFSSNLLPPGGSLGFYLLSSLKS